MKKGFTIVEVSILFVIFIIVAFLVAPLSIDDTVQAKNTSKWRVVQQEFTNIYSSIISEDNEAPLPFSANFETIIDNDVKEDIKPYRIKLMNNTLPESLYTFNDYKSTFSGALRTVLRQDPDIILVGEIRDYETAEIAVQAGQTGHYVLSTIHTIDSIEVITRLRKMGISNYDIASTLDTTISQRLVRKLCPKCRQERDFTDYEIKKIETIERRYWKIICVYKEKCVCFFCMKVKEKCLRLNLMKLQFHLVVM